MLREYEFTVIAKSDLGEKDVEKFLQKYETLMKKDGGEILKKDDWGSKRLSFPIKKQFKGHYMFYDFVGENANVAEMERLMRLDENVLRYMCLRTGENVDTAKRKEELSKERVFVDTVEEEEISLEDSSDE